MLNAQDDHKMFLSIMLEPNLDQISAFEKNLAEHNRKFHTEGFRKDRIPVRTYSVCTILNPVRDIASKSY